jgi:hypothetical protein
LGFVCLAAVALALTLMVSIVSFVAIGNGPCGGSGGVPNLPAGSNPAVCKLLVPGYGQVLYGGASGNSAVPRVLAKILAPVLIVLAGVIASALLGEYRSFKLALLVAAVVVTLPWIGVVLFAS